ncbi:hypothetical protein G5S34_17565 [Herbaspirillum frisingense]|uniref:hypothetical protein n=1 Tax=Herbaspirillum frisingense TaxID=92645 RepID=UPI001603F0B7|nr:hypothetical protein [Herbaspirillum frisingense]QNB08381.1 hypothetical protein G5S34_17565 [Herbaspirillum frisingense]
MSQEQQTTTLQAIKNPAPREQNMPAVTMGFGSLQSFELMQRAAKMLAHSTLVPVAYRTQKEIKEYGKVVGYEDQPSALPNCVVALNMAQRMGADPLMVMQNLYIVEGRPSWSSQFIIAAINSCGRYTPLRFMLSEPAEPRDIEYVETKWVKGNKTEVKRKLKVANRTCVAWAIEKETGERLESPEISIDMAIAEGWLTKNGSKWQTMPEVMLRYRAAAFFGKLYAPELLMGLQTAEEAADIIDIDMPEAQPRPATDINQLRKPPQGSAAAPDADIEDVEDKKPDTPESQAGEPGEPEAGTAAGPAGETSQQAAQGKQQSGGDQGQGLSYAKVRDSLEKAGDLEVLDVAADLISEVADPAQQEELRAFYRERKEVLTTAPAGAGTTTRRAKPQQQNFNVE